MNKVILTAKLLDLAEGRETPETWWSWWDEHETELETLLNCGEFLKLKPRRHSFQWVPVLTSQKGAIWYYAHEQDKVKRLCNDMTELLEKKLARYLNEH